MGVDEFLALLGEEVEDPDEGTSVLSLLSIYASRLSTEWHVPLSIVLAIHRGRRRERKRRRSFVRLFLCLSFTNQLLETFLLFSQPIPSQNLGFLDPKAAELEVAVGGREYTIQQSPGVLESSRAGGTTGAGSYLFFSVLSRCFISFPSPLGFLFPLL